jgi:hypothetical protein
MGLSSLLYPVENTAALFQLRVGHTSHKPGRNLICHAADQSGHLPPLRRDADKLGTPVFLIRLTHDVAAFFQHIQKPHQ